MKKNIAIAVALLTVGYAFWGGLGFTNSMEKPEGSQSGASLALPSLSFNLPSFGLNGATLPERAWQVFQSYLDAAQRHDIEALASLSYQLSPACKDPERMEECFGLMDSVYYFAQGFKREDFKNVAYDEHQTVLSTDYLMLEGANDPIKSVLYFVNENGSPKVLGIRFCIGTESNERCLDTDPKTRDSNRNGWWDDVETLFK